MYRVNVSVYGSKVTAEDQKSCKGIKKSAHTQYVHAEIYAVQSFRCKNLRIAKFFEELVYFLVGYNFLPEDVSTRFR